MKKTNKLILDKSTLTYTYTKLDKFYQIIYFDIYKAYDNVNIDTLFNFIMKDDKITPEFKNLALQEYFDIKNYCMKIGSEILNRKIGLAQGSLLSPSLFNYYISKILENYNIQRYLMDENINLYIYADNVILLLKDNFSDTYIEDIINSFKYTLGQYNMKFDKPNILKFNKVAIPICDIGNFPNIGDTLRILGIEFYIHNRSLCINYSKMLFNFIPIKCIPFYKAIKHIRKFYLGKFNFYYKFLEIFAINISKEYKDWFIERIISFLKKTCIIIKINKEIIEKIMFSTYEENNLESKENPFKINLDKCCIYYSYWAASFENNFKDKILYRYYNLCKETYKSTGFIDAKDAINYILYENKYKILNGMKYYKTLEILDDIYFGIKTKRNLYENVLFNNLNN